MAEEEETAPSLKRAREQEETGENTESSEDDDIGPALPSAQEVQQPRKKRKRLPHEKQYIAALPAGTRYSKSLMHREQLAFVTLTPYTDFLITSSVDGYVKFWKKVAAGDVEFVKEYKAHEGEIRSVTVSADGRSYATAGVDKTVKIFDVETFDLLAIIELQDLPPKCICFVHAKGSGFPLLAVSSQIDGRISIFDGRGENTAAIHTMTGLHRKPVHLMSYNNAYDCVISADEGGMLEYWQPSGSYEKPHDVFQMKSSTDLFEFKKRKAVPCSLTISPTGQQFATFSFPDRKIRIFNFASGKLYRTYDESIETVTTMNQAGTLGVEMDAVEFGRRIAVERELEDFGSRLNVIFDESGNFLLYGSLAGVKVLNTLTNRIVKIYGNTEPFRPLNLALYQGQPQKKGVITVQMAASDNPLLQQAEERDAMLVSTGSGKLRFYVFTNETEAAKSTRDVHNEKPRNVAGGKKTNGDAAAEQDTRRAASATIHTTEGDIQVRLYPTQVPKTVENFTIHARENYYNNIIFHRVIRKFMIQTGDPLGDGTGGESIWGGQFEDEFHPDLDHKSYTLSMANSGANTNASQFFITTERTPWLDGKHTVFGRVVRGMDVVHAIENTKTYKERPVKDIKIVNISLGT
ncbi:peptidyl-prolyl cis-trans isomerase cypE [Polychaeton citri CBS 116435]|uniref:Peptidyl-prolyl cis-trans isomerase-like 1 n=1 Tax=Polychaeton citri CBS 116435 TaxID=1314669 RepID=A0A9P4Q677_9PEZI|nr:peptidyl-prolyl cis-trans isomerase cypE [Polychaeton citri CBS 116435]